MDMIYKEVFSMKLFFFLCVFVFETNAQSEFNHSSIRVSESDLQNSYYSKDSTANAVVVYEYGMSFIRNVDFDIVTDYKRKVKIFNRKGFEEGTVKLFLYKKDNNYEKVLNIEAKTYNKNPDGSVEITKLEKDHIFKEDYNEHYDLLKFTLPNLKEGSVITISYRIISPYIFNFYEWNFQESIPKLYSEYNTKIPGNYTYNIKLVGWKKLDVNEQDIEKECISYGTATADCTKSIYVMKNIPAFIPEKYMTTEKNYRSKIAYELMSVQYFDGRKRNYTKSWKTVDSEIKLSTSLGKALRKTSHLKELIPEAFLKGLKGVEKANKIYQYVVDRYTWNGEKNVFEGISTRDLVKEKKGSVTEINVLLNGLLELNGFDSHLVLMSTRKNGLPTKLYPIISEFNYAIVKVAIEGEEYLLDASDNFLVFGQIPFKCLNGYGRVLNFKEGSDWLPIKVDEYSSTLNYVELKLKENHIFEGTLKTRYTGYHANDKKKSYYDNETAYVDALENKLLNIDITNHTVLSTGVEDANFKETIRITSDEIEGSDVLFFNPFIHTFFSENPFKLNKRTYPVDFGYKDKYTYTLILDVGEAYSIKETPKNVRMQLPDNKGEFSLLTSFSGTKIRLTFNLKFHEAVYSPYFYEALKELMKSVVDVQTNSIVVLKKKEKL